MNFIDYYESTIGLLEIKCNDNYLLSLKITKEINTKNTNNIIKETKKQLEYYFNNKLKKFDIPIKLNGSKFDITIWNILQKIPYGQTKNYKQIAILSNNKNTQRAVGNANGRNPIIIIIPCHRVIKSNGEIGGYAYGKNIKQKLLDLENNYL